MIHIHDTSFSTRASVTKSLRSSAEGLRSPRLDFPRSYRAHPAAPAPLAPTPAEPLCKDLILTRFRPDFDLKSHFSGRIRSTSGQNRVRIRSGQGHRGGRVHCGRSGWGGSAHPESLYPRPSTPKSEAQRHTESQIAWIEGGEDGCIQMFLGLAYQASTGKYVKTGGWGWLFHHRVHELFLEHTILTLKRGTLFFLDWM